MKRNVYLNLMPVNDAYEAFIKAFNWVELAGSQAIDTVDSLGRVTAEPQFAVYSSPAYNAAAMDGYAVNAADTYEASPEKPLELLTGEQAVPVNTGNPMPEGRNAVIMIEQVHQPDREHIEITAPVFPWQHVRKVGEDIVAKEMLLPHHHRITAADLAALLAAGVYRLNVLNRPRVAIIPTGTELLDWREAAKAPPAPGQIIETNSHFLAGLIKEAGGEPVVMERCPDEFEKVKQAVQNALAGEAHMVMLNAGASAGSMDYSVHVLNELGEVLVHGIQAMPGKPSILGRAGGKPVVGAPGYPVSAWVCIDQFVAPALSLMQGQLPAVREKIPAVASRRLASKLGQEEFLRVHLGRVGDRVVATSLKRGAGAITTLTRADGLVRIARESDGVEQGDQVSAEFLRGRKSADNTLVIVGSHDVSLDILADRIKKFDPRILVSSTHLGSMGGLMAIRDGNCHLGGTHLLDPLTGDYNVSYCQKHLPGVRVRLVTLADRMQGFIVPKGNPKGIKVLADLAREDVNLINRQAGSGTRVLLDYLLAQEGLVPENIRGYYNDEYTHMAVAVQVLTGGADVGIGVLAAAEALGLDFIPLATERYDLCIPVQHWDDPRVEALRRVLEDHEFRRAVQAMGGYDVNAMGRIAWEG